MSSMKLSLDNGGLVAFLRVQNDLRHVLIPIRFKFGFPLPIL